MFRCKGCKPGSADIALLLRDLDQIHYFSFFHILGGNVGLHSGVDSVYAIEDGAVWGKR